MRIERLRLTNFRGFSALDIEFPAHGTTVFVGNNGAGKTTILDAIRILLFELEHRARYRDGVPAVGITAADVSKGCSECLIELSSAVPRPKGESPIHKTWQVTWPRVYDHKSAAALDAILAAIRPPGTWPIRAYYPVERSALGTPLSLPTSAPTADENEDPDEDEVRDTLSFATFLEWFVKAENLENEKIREIQDFRDPRLDAVRSAIEQLCEGFSRPRIQRAQRARERTRLVVDKVAPETGRKETFDLAQLSHGERGLIALVGDIARRLTLTFRTQDLLAGPGVVLIDEAELHLHPSWQRNLIPRLERTFPNVQFILTTHSPQILSQVHPENIKIIENFRLMEHTPPTYGRDSNSILSDVMGVPERPEFAAAKLEELAILIDDENWDAARERLQTLTQDLGELDAEVTRLRTMINLLDDRTGTAA